MLTEPQQKEIAKYLSDKKLPLDLLLEIEDHISEQIVFLMTSKNIDFEQAFLAARNDWRNDLKLNFSIFGHDKRTRIHAKTIKETWKKFLLKSIQYFLPFFFLSICATFLTKNFAYYLFLFANLFLFAAMLIVIVFDFKIIKTSMVFYSKRISYLQKGISSLSISFLCMGFYMIPHFNLYFEHYYQSIIDLIQLKFDLQIMMHIIFMYIYIFISILGFLYYFEYKKVIQQLKQKCNLKL